MDSSIEILEVTTGTSGSNEFINSIDKIPAQQFVKRWTHRINAIGMSNDMSNGYDSDEKDTTNILTLIGDEATYCKLADKVANTQADILADLGAADARIIKSSTADSISQLFVRNHKTMDRLLSSIAQREEISMTIESQLTEVITKQNNKIDIRVVGKNQNANYTSSRNSDIYSLADVYSTSKRRDIRNKKRLSQHQNQTSNYNQLDQDEITRIRLTRDLNSLLNELASDYKQVISIARKFPGTIPAEISVNLLESKLTAVRMKLRSL